MARKPNVVDPALKEQLRQKVIARFAREIRNSGHCLELSVELQNLVRTPPSPTTLRRFFGISDSRHSVSAHTLDVLSFYTGFRDWSHFVTSATGQHSAPTLPPEQIRQYEEFYMVKVRDEKDINFHNACKIIATHILSHPDLTETLLTRLAGLPNGQIYFYERFPYIDGLGNGYDRGLRYYLQSKTDAQAQVFGHSLLVLGAFLRNDRKSFQREWTLFPKRDADPGWHEFVVARYIGSHLLHAEITGDDREKTRWLAEIDLLLPMFQKPATVDFWKFPYFPFMIADYLNLVGEYDKSYECLHPFRQNGKDDFLTEDGYYEALKIILAVAQAGRNNASLAQELWLSVDHSRLGIIFRKFYALQYLSVSLVAAAGNPKDNHRIRSEIDQLTADTGFAYFLRNL